MNEVCLIRLRGSNIPALSDLAERLGTALTGIGRRVAIPEKCAAPEVGRHIIDMLTEGPERVYIRLSNQPDDPGMISVEFRSVSSCLDEASARENNHSLTEIGVESRLAAEISVSADEADQAVRAIISTLEHLKTISGPRGGYTSEEEDLVARRLRELGYL